MPSWLIIVLVVLGCIYLWRYSARFLIQSVVGDREIQGVDIFMGGVLGLAFVFIVPISLIWRLLDFMDKPGGDLTAVSKVLYGQTRKQKKKAKQMKEAQRMDEIEAARARINSLERDNGIPLTEWT